MTLDDLKECLRVEIIGADHPFSWRKALTRTRHHHRKKFMFWWRLAAYLHNKGTLQNKLARYIERRLKKNFDITIPLTVKIGKGLQLAYLSGVIIGKNCRMGQNVCIKQGVTIGDRNALSDVTIGNNVMIGCNSSILGGEITIGDGVIIGAHSLVIDSIPSDSVYINKVIPVIKPRYE